MAQQVQELIDKIKREGLAAADQNAKRIEDEAQKNAQKILAEARQKAEHLTAQAQAEIQREKISVRTALQQAARDTVLSLRKEIEQILKKIVLHEVRGALTPDKLAEVMRVVIEKSLNGGIQDVSVEAVLSPQDAEQIRKGFLEKIQNQIKRSITLQSSEDIGKGFTISFDGGRSCFDFTDESLAEYLSTFLNSHVCDLLKESVAKKK